MKNGAEDASMKYVILSEDVLKITLKEALQDTAEWVHRARDAGGDQSPTFDEHVETIITKTQNRLPRSRPCVVWEGVVGDQRVRLVDTGDGRTRLHGEVLRKDSLGAPSWVSVSEEFRLELCEKALVQMTDFRKR